MRRRNLGTSAALMGEQLTLRDIAIDLRVGQFRRVAAIDILHRVQAGRRIDRNVITHRAAVQVFLGCRKVLDGIETLLVEVCQVKSVNPGQAIKDNREVCSHGKCAVAVIRTSNTGDRECDLALVVIGKVVKVLVQLTRATVARSAQFNLGQFDGIGASLAIQGVPYPITVDVFFGISDAIAVGIPAC